VSRPLSQIGRRLPHGWGDLIRQLALFLLAYQAYQLVRGIADGRAAVAFLNGDRVIELERSLGAFFEPGFQRALMDVQWLIDFANFMYINSHYVITASFLTWLYLFRNEHFYFVRNMFMIAMLLALVGYAAFPTAPPRFYPEWGFTDTVAVFTGVEQDSKAISLLVNPFAAVPSMHCAFALMIAVPGAALVRTAVARWLWSLYPLMVLFVVVVTANHYWFDAAAGAAVACLAALGARQLARLRPAAWAWREAPGEVVA
jgi:membrane-associated phospholipid phosphatase